MTNFNLHDVVIITKNPPNQIVKIKGDVGYIDEFQEATNEKGEVVKLSSEQSLMRRDALILILVL